MCLLVHVQFPKGASGQLPEKDHKVFRPDNTTWATAKCTAAAEEGRSVVTNTWLTSIEVGLF
jgi:hypothetical protein